jgi:acyl dehydratase
VVAQIVASAQAEHIAAVTGVGVSPRRPGTRWPSFVAIGATVTADDMNLDADHQR